MSGNTLNAKRFTAVALLLSIFSCLCILVATFGSAWIVIDSNNLEWTLNEGIWLAQFCDDYGTKCKISSREAILADIGLDASLSSLSEPHWVEFKVFTILSVTGSLATVVMATVIVVRKTKQPINPPVLILCGITCFSSCIFILVPMLKISAVSGDLFDLRTWSLYTAGAGALTQFICSCLFVMANYQNCRRLHKLKQWNEIRRQRSEIVMNYLTSQCDVSNRANQSDYINRDDSSVWTTSDTQNPILNYETESVRSSSCMRSQLPAYNEIMAN